MTDNPTILDLCVAAYSLTPDELALQERTSGRFSRRYDAAENEWTFTMRFQGNTIEVCGTDPHKCFQRLKRRLVE